MATTATSAAFFDLDKTIIATSSSSAFSREFLGEGMLSRSHAVKTGYAHMLFMLSGADERSTERVRAALSSAITGWDVDKVRRIVSDTVLTHIDPVVYAEALSLMRRHQAHGRPVVIVSAAATEIVEPIAEMLGADVALGSVMESTDGRYTGKITDYLYGDAKAEAITKLAAAHGWDLEQSFAYSDSITDAPLLDAVGFGYAVNPDRSLRLAAAVHGWGTLRFRTPEAIREEHHKRILVAGAVAGVAVSSIVAWWLTRKRWRGGQ